MGQRAAYWIEKYLLTIRSQLLTDINEQVLFVNDYGDPFRDNKLGDRVKRL
jgi:site-specific recombinase XerD